MHMRKSPLLLVVCIGLAISSQAFAHIALESPLPRSEAQKQGPCGATGSARGPAQTYEPGETITVSWDETVDHVGHYRVAFNLDGDEFPLPNNPDDDFPSVLVDQITDRQGGGKYSQDITFPDVECDNCTLQLIQVMTTTVPYNSFYFQCSDIILAMGAPGGPDAGDGGSTPKPTTGGCSTAGTRSGLAGFFLLGFACFAVARRRRQGAY